MDRLSYYKSFYDNELKKRDELDKSINNPILIITIIFGILSFITEKVNFKCISKIEIILLCIILIISIIICKSIYHSIISYNNGIKGYGYEVLGTNTEFEKYRMELIEFYGGEDNKKNAEMEYEEYIIDTILKSV